MASKLVPVFMPPLAQVLAAAEAKKGRALSARGVEKIRDKAVCMMMTRAEAAALRASRGFRDVDPEDVWADWHRLRVQLTGRGYLPKIVLCAVGDEGFGRRAERLLTKEKIEHEVRAANPRMATSFDASAFRLEPTFADSDREAVAKHARVVYALSANFTAGEAIATSRRFLALGARLLEACGGTALKCESSGIAHGRAKWLELSRDEDTSALVRAFVQFPIGDSDDLWTCGMHLLGRPDLVIGRAVLGDDLESARLFDTFAVYVLTECGDDRPFASGHTFRCDADSPRLRATWEACEGYEEDSFFFNSFGRLRFAPAIHLAPTER
jgi:hypothetical protein